MSGRSYWLENINVGCEDYITCRFASTLKWISMSHFSVYSRLSMIESFDMRIISRLGLMNVTFGDYVIRITRSRWQSL